jgi:GNAT superfamily N-acetyltransferase
MSVPSETKTLSARSLDDFRGDYAEVASLMEQSWSGNNQQPLLYTSAFLASCFEYPGAHFSLAPTIYFESTPVGFVAGFPRTVYCPQGELRLLLITFLTVAPEYKKKGYGIILWNELVSRTRSMGFDGMVNYCVGGGDMDAMILACCERSKLPTERVFSIHYLSKAILPSEAIEGSRAACVDPELFIRTVAPLRESHGLVRTWTAAEAEWQCQLRVGAIGAQHSLPQRPGLLTGYIMPIMNARRTKCLFIEDVLWASLQPDECLALLQQLIGHAAAAGAQMATVPVCGYADLQPFKASGFQRSRRVVNAYLTLWRESQSPGPVSSFYLDVL